MQCFQKKLLQLHAKNFLWSESTALSITMPKCAFLPNRRYNLLFLRNFEELLQKLNPFCFTYQQVDCLSTLFKYRFSGNRFVRSGQVFENVQIAVCFNQRNREMDRMPSIAKRRLLRREDRKQILSSFQKTKSMQTS